VKTFATILPVGVLLTVAIAQTPHIQLVEGTPPTKAFDISWVDNSSQRDYLADRTNNAIDLGEASTDTFLGFIGKGQYTRSRPVRASLKTYATAQGRMESSRIASGTCGPEVSLRNSCSRRLMHVPYRCVPASGKPIRKAQATERASAES